ncbi:hypothetical protein Bbelb_190890 [Branchiostoma belcheri]|nr:hypothetical protein Bbelb_190890 [Branchiostoma belcheri]
MIHRGALPGRLLLTKTPAKEEKLAAKTSNCSLTQIATDSNDGGIRHCQYFSPASLNSPSRLQILARRRKLTRYRMDRLYCLIFGEIRTLFSAQSLSCCFLTRNARREIRNQNGGQAGGRSGYFQNGSRNNLAHSVAPTAGCVMGSECQKKLRCEVRELRCEVKKK